VSEVLRLCEVSLDEVRRLLTSIGLEFVCLPPRERIPASYWGAAEAGLRGRCLYARADTPMHSLLHEASHYACMSQERRAALDTDAGGDELEECAVCVLQVLLAEQLPGMGKARMLADMDAWGYSFRLGSARRWWATDAQDGRDWLQAHLDRLGRCVVPAAAL
jgi:hypothetical protein